MRRFIAGRNPVLSILKNNNIKVINVKIDKNAKEDSKINEILALCENKNVNIIYVDRNTLRDYSQSQGIVAEFTKEDNFDLEEILLNNPFIIILREIMYKQNFGAIIRTCNIAGVNLLVLPKKNKNLHLDSEVARISEGASLNMNFLYTNLFEFIDKLKLFNVSIFGIENIGDDIYFNTNLKGSVAFLFGSEASSISEPLTKRCDKILKIPQSEKSTLNSLNIASSVSIVVYEKVRQNSI